MTILASVNNKTVMPGITPIADVPDRPTIGTATAAGLAASITFTAATTGGTPTTFTATSNPGSLTGTASSSPITVSGLTADTSYTFTVTAGNSTGTSPASVASNSITAVSPISGGYDALATVVVGTAVSSVVFAGIPTGYKHLQIRYLARTTSANPDQGNVNMQFNSDTGGNYATHRLVGNSSIALATAATSQTSILSGIAARDGETNNVFGAGIIDILDYTNTNKYTTIRTLTGEDANSGADEYIGLHSGLWMNTAAVTTIAFTTPSSNFKQHSHFALYGVK